MRFLFRRNDNFSFSLKKQIKNDYNVFFAGICTIQKCFPPPLHVLLLSLSILYLSFLLSLFLFLKISFFPNSDSDSDPSNKQANETVLNRPELQSDHLIIASTSAGFHLSVTLKEMQST